MLDLPDLPERVRAVTVNSTSATVPAAVLPAERQAGYRVARLLLDGGHREGIAVIGNAPLACSDPRISVTIGERFAGIHQALDEAGRHQSQ